MQPNAVRATVGDLAELSRLYRELETELTALKAVWRITEALPDPVEQALAALLEDPASTVLIGRIDDVPVGFLVGNVAPMLPQSEAAHLASIKYLFTEEPAREVGVAEALLETFLEEAGDAGIEHFDAHVSPGHRVAKNFFEANGFKARHIVMHRGPGR